MVVRSERNSQSILVHLVGVAERQMEKRCHISSEPSGNTRIFWLSVIVQLPTGNGNDCLPEPGRKIV